MGIWGSYLPKAAFYLLKGACRVIGYAVEGLGFRVVGPAIRQFLSPTDLHLSHLSGPALQQANMGHNMAPS